MTIGGTAVWSAGLGDSGRPGSNDRAKPRGCVFEWEREVASHDLCTNDLAVESCLPVVGLWTGSCLVCDVNKELGNDDPASAFILDINTLESVSKTF